MMDLVGLNGYYSMISMVLNVGRTPLPPGNTPWPQAVPEVDAHAGSRGRDPDPRARNSVRVSTTSTARSITSTPPPTRSTSSGATPRRTTARSSASAPPRLPSGVSPACFSRSNRCSRSWDPGRPRSSGHSIRHVIARRSIRSSIAGSGDATSWRCCSSSSGCCARRGPSSASSWPGTIRPRRTSRPRSRRSRRERCRRISAPHTAVCRSVPASATSFRVLPRAAPASG